MGTYERFLLHYIIPYFGLINIENAITIWPHTKNKVVNISMLTIVLLTGNNRKRKRHGKMKR